MEVTFRVLPSRACLAVRFLRNEIEKRLRAVYPPPPSEFLQKFIHSLRIQASFNRALRHVLRVGGRFWGRENLLGVARLLSVPFLFRAYFWGRNIFLFVLDFFLDFFQKFLLLLIIQDFFLKVLGFLPEFF